MQDLGKRCKKVACGCYCTFAVSDGGDVLACGFNKRGNLGLGKKQYKTFSHIHQLRDAARTVCPSRFNYNTLVLSSNKSTSSEKMDDSVTDGTLQSGSPAASEGDDCLGETSPRSAPVHALSQEEYHSV